MEKSVVYHHIRCIRTGNDGQCNTFSSPPPPGTLSFKAIFRMMDEEAYGTLCVVMFHVEHRPL